MANKTYESIYTKPDGTELIIARGDSPEYVKRIAQQAQFVPYTIKEYQTEENVREMYRAWRAENGNKKPNRVVVKMRWEDGDNSPKGYQVDTVAIHHGGVAIDNLPSDDCWILYYVFSLKGLLELMKPNNGSDFVVDEVLEFWKK